MLHMEAIMIVQEKDTHNKGSFIDKDRHQPSKKVQPKMPNWNALFMIVKPNSFWMK